MSATVDGLIAPDRILHRFPPRHRAMRTARAPAGNEENPVGAARSRPTTDCARVTSRTVAVHLRPHDRPDGRRRTRGRAKQRGLNGTTGQNVK